MWNEAAVQLQVQLQVQVTNDSSQWIKILDIGYMLLLKILHFQKKKYEVYKIK